MTFLLMIPECGYAVISFISSPTWKRLCGGLSSFRGQEEGLPPLLPPSPSPFKVLSTHIKPEPCFSNKIKSRLGCEHLSILLIFCRCFQSGVCQLLLSLRLKGAMSIVSSYGGACRAKENLFPLGFHGSLQSLHPGSQGQSKLMEEFQCSVAVPRSKV